MFTDPSIYCLLLIVLSLLLLMGWNARKSRQFCVSSADGQRHFCRTSKSAASTLTMMLRDSSYDAPYVIVDTGDRDNKVSVTCDGFYAHVQCRGSFVDHEAQIVCAAREIGYTVSKF